MKFNMEFYEEKKGKTNDKEIENIKEYIENTNIQKNYEEQFLNNITDKELYHLSTQSQNILNWYPFSKEMKVLEIGGGLGELTGILCDRVTKVVTIETDLENARLLAKRHQNRENLEVIVGNFEKIRLDEKFDIITLIGIIPKINQLMNKQVKLIECIKHLEQFLKNDGKFLIAVDNKFGLRYFSGHPENIFNKKFESLIGYNDYPEKIETFTKTSLEKMLKNIGYNTNFYYPLPDYKLPNVIFTDKELAKYNSVDKYVPYPTSKSDTIFNEIDVFREILKTDSNMFPFFANSFLVEVSKNQINPVYKYISFNNMRKQEYRLITKIADTYVEKQIVSKEANNHYQEIKQNLDILKERSIQTVDYIENDTIRSKYIEQKYLLNNVLTQFLEENETQKFDNILNKYIEILKIQSFKNINYKETVFAKYNIPIENGLLQELHFVKNGLWDMTFKNCFYINDTFYFFDQEWNEPNVPIEFILYRSILYTISLRRYININTLFEKYNLNKYLVLFEKLDNALQENIRDEKIWEFYSKNTYFDIDSSKQELINIGIRDEAKQKAINNLESEKQDLISQNQKLKLENEKLLNQYNILKEKEQKRITQRIKNKLKSFNNGERKKNNNE